jgi:hypothetical protein
MIWIGQRPSPVAATANSLLLLSVVVHILLL